MVTESLYEDSYVRLTKTGLELKWYYFPSASNRHIDLASIRQLNYASQGLSFATKGWGMAFSNVWWACDLARSVPFRKSTRTNVTVNVGEERFDKGFSVEDWDSFFDAIKPLLSPNVQINAFLPYGASSKQPPEQPEEKSTENAAN